VPTPAPHQKCPQRSPPKVSQKSSDAPPVKGMFIQRCSYSFVLCSLYLTFVVLASGFRLTDVSTDGGAKKSGHEETHYTKSPSS
jgi:hypothetical protein